MNSILGFLAGFGIGVLFMSLLSRWVSILFSALGRNPEEKKPATGAGLTGVRILAVMHPAPWLILVGLPYLIYRFFVGSLSPGWVCFFAGVILSVVSVLILSFLIARYSRKKKLAAEKAVGNKQGEA